MGRPKKDPKLAAEQVQQLASLGLRDQDIALVAGLSERTLQTRFRAQLTAGRAQLRASLSAYLWQRAAAGSDRVLIWLAQQHLGHAPAAPRTHDYDELRIHVEVDPDAAL